MTTDTRSYSGCWTCWLRRRKCDETQPTCSQCRSFNLTCHGPNVKPEWMDGGVKQRAELTAIKLMVAKISKQRRVPQANRHVRGLSSYAIPHNPVRSADEMQDASANGLFHNINEYSHLASETFTPFSSTQGNGSRDGRRQSIQRKQKTFRNM